MVRGKNEKFQLPERDRSIQQSENDHHLVYVNAFIRAKKVDERSMIVCRMLSCQSGCWLTREKSTDVTS